MHMESDFPVNGLIDLPVVFPATLFRIKKDE